MFNLSGLILSSYLFTSAIGREVVYDDNVFLQVMSPDKLWLNGCRRKGNEHVQTSNILKEMKVEDSYKWKILPTKGENGCVKFGDEIILTNQCELFVQLSGARDYGNKNVYTRNMLRSKYEYVKASKSYLWVVRSNTGDLGAEEPNKGKCVLNKNVIYLQNMGMNRKWLEGGARVATDDLGTKGAIADSFKWVIRLDSPGKGDTEDALDTCLPMRGRGYWKDMYDTCSGYECTYKVEVTASDEKTQSVLTSEEYEELVIADVTAGFDVLVNEGGYRETKISVNGTLSRNFESMITDVFTSSRKEIVEKKLAQRKGIFGYQFVFDLPNSCGGNITIETSAAVLADSHPCCLPGDWSRNGRCLEGPDLCGGYNENHNYHESATLS